MELIDKAAVVAEIERQQRKLCLLSQSNKVELHKDAAIQNGVYCSLLSFIDTLEVKEVDLDKSLTDFMGRYAYENGSEYPSAIDIAKHFFELGLKAQKGK